MANDRGHGGYRQPRHPAAVSGPGAHSRRTDGRPKQVQLDDAKYGEAKAFEEIQRGAKLAGPTQGSPGNLAPSAGSMPPVTAPTPIGAATEFPDQPVTSGADAGPGAGASILGLPSQETEAQDLRRRYGDLLPWLIRMADSQYSSQEFRDEVRYLVSQIG